MSENKHNEKSSARQRLQEQREKEKARARRGRQLKVAGAVVAVLAIAGGIAAWSASRGGNGEGGDFAMAKGTSDGDKPAVPVGQAQAPATLQVWEDFRCPACRQFEVQFRDVVHELVDSGQLRVDYHLATIIDNNTSGTGSLNAGNAALCAQDQGRFRDYHDVLYANQPDERQDTFADKKYLVKLAGKVPGLGTGRFRNCVEHGTYNAFVTKSAKAFSSSGFSGTPTILLNGKNLFEDQSAQITPQKFKEMVLAAAKGSAPSTGASPTATPPSGSPS
ncbi:DsbA family protein [Streptomyces sp. NPDC059740]|uniref:DsbA family protein n=1 Tax=Streptomyces sp. NPDC059740 TaxID=3346926 RepID=UPI003656AF9A